MLIRACNRTCLPPPPGSRKKEKASKEKAASDVPRITLEMVMRENPGISLPDAFQKLTFLRAQDEAKAKGGDAAAAATVAAAGVGAAGAMPGAAGAGATTAAAAAAAAAAAGSLPGAIIAKDVRESW